MIQRSLWTRPALQKSEAVLLPALPRFRTAEPLYSDRHTRAKADEEVFRPIAPDTSGPASLALSPYVRSRGSMAGRSVLRAAGVFAEPYARRGRATYPQGFGNRKAPRFLRERGSMVVQRGK